MRSSHFLEVITMTLLAGCLLALSPGLQADDPAAQAAASVPAPIMLTPQEVFRDSGDGAVRMTVLEGDPGKANVLYTFRTELPDHFMIPPHFHPADEHITIISGTFNMGMGDHFDQTKTKAMPAGSFAVMPKGCHHFAWTEGKTIIQVHAIGPWGMTFVNPQDHPCFMKDIKQ